MRYFLLLFLYALFSLLSSILEGLSISILPVVLRVLLSSGEINLIPALRAFRAYLEGFILTGDPFTSIRNLSIFVAGIFILKLLVNSAKKFSILYLQEAIARDLRDRIYTSLILADYGKIRDVRLGDILNNMTVDINNVKLAVRDGIGSVIGDGLNLFVFLFLAITSAPILSLFAWGILLLSALLGWHVSKVVKRRTTKAMDIFAELSSFLANTFDGIKVIKSLNLTKNFISKFSRISKRLFEKSLKLEFSAALAPVLSESLVGITASVILFLSGYFIYKAGTVSPDAFIVFLASSLSTIRPLKLLFQSLAYIQSARVSLRRIGEITSLPKESWGSLDPTNWKVLSFKGVRVNYGGKRVLEIEDLEIRRGERIIIMGKSGSGKSTFLDLLAGFVKPSEGDILLDGKSLYDYDLYKWRSMLGFLPQEPFVFDGTLEENLLGNYEILKELNLEHLRERLRDFEVNLKGKISGGEKQRIALGRVLTGKPSFLILDEPTSALDLKNEERIGEILRKLKDITLIVVAHKESLLSWGERLIVFDNGKVVFDGKP
jgi:ABC-type bacteriocin/lantibiotic exporter with double-glycine peptidase domain